MFYNDAGRHQRALRAASEAMIAEGHAQEALLTPSEFDDVFTIESPWWPEPRDEHNVAWYIDSVDEQKESVDFVALQEYVFSRREVAFKKRGVIYDPIDDAGIAPIPKRTHLWGMMRAEQIERHLDEILTSGAEVRTLAYYLPPEFSIEHRDKLIAAGVEMPEPKRQSIGNKIARLFSRS